MSAERSERVPTRGQKLGFAFFLLAVVGFALVAADRWAKTTLRSADFAESAIDSCVRAGGSAAQCGCAVRGLQRDASLGLMIRWWVSSEEVAGNYVGRCS